MNASTEVTPKPSPNPASNTDASLAETDGTHEDAPPRYTEAVITHGDDNSSKARKQDHFRRGSKTSLTGSGQSGTRDLSHEDEDNRSQVRDSDWLVSDDAGMGFG